MAVEAIRVTVLLEVELLTFLFITILTIQPVTITTASLLPAVAAERDTAALMVVLVVV